MKKIALIGTITIIAILLFSISSFATNNNNNMASDAANGMRNVMDGAGNVMEDAASSISNGVRNGVSAVKNTLNGGMTSDTDDNFANDNANYNATRTATTRTLTAGTTGGFLGMSETTWSWIILGIVGIITVALVWYYGKEHEASYNHNDDNY